MAQDYPPQTMQPTYPQPAPPAPGRDLTANLQELAALKHQGVLTDEEFAMAKGKLLGS